MASSLPASQIRVDVVANCLAELRNLKIHPLFSGYLCLKRVSVREGNEVGLKPNFKEFFDTFLRVPGGPPDKPYVLPFSESSPSEANRWFNKNVAGSYAPSSLRSVSPFIKVAKIDGGGSTAMYSLRPNHWALALTHLTYGAPIPVVPLAVFLYRDYAIQKEQPTISDLVTIFRVEFGYTGDKESAEFQVLYKNDSATRLNEGWFEPVA